MVDITYIEHDGTAHAVAAREGESLMINAVDNMVPGTDADCGGACACATCHIYIPQEWREKIGERNDMEEAMLQLAEAVAENSRLACQIDVRSDMEGLVVHLPESQH